MVHDKLTLWNECMSKVIVEDFINKYNQKLDTKMKLEGEIAFSKDKERFAEDIFKTVKGQLEEHIKKVFGGVTISQIYSKIEPHKRFTKLRYKININENGNPELYLKVLNEKNEDNIDGNDSLELPVEDEKVNLHVDSNLEQPTKETIDLNIPVETVSQNLNNENNVSEEENKIVGMPSLDLSTSNLIKTSNTESEVKVPTFEVPAPNIPVNIESKVDVNNNVPLNEEEVNSILDRNKIDEPVSKEEISEVIINEPSEPAKIANSTEAKVQTILGVWSKYKVPKTIIKYDIKKDENVRYNIIRLRQF